MTIGRAPDRQLVVLSCSATKRDDSGLLPALERYNGPMYQVLRSFLRQAEWPPPLSVAVLSAKYGLIGGLAAIDTYDQRMTRDRSADLKKGSSTELLRNWSQSHSRVNLLLGKDYLSALDLDTLDHQGVETEVVKGPIGMKLNGLKTLLHGLEHRPRFGRPNELVPGVEDMDRLHEEVFGGGPHTDLPPTGSDLQALRDWPRSKPNWSKQLESWSDDVRDWWLAIGAGQQRDFPRMPAMPNPLSLEYRLGRCLRTVEVEDDTIQESLDEFDGVVARIEESVAEESDGERLTESWEANPREETCTVCDFRTFCPASRYQGAPSAP